MRATILITLLVAAVSANLHVIDFKTTIEEQVVNAKTGDLITISLRENPTTGYSWKFQDPFQKSSGVYSVQMDDFSTQNDDGAVGSTGTRTIVVRAEKAGSDDFEVIYVRSWEYKDFVEQTQATNGQAVPMKEIPNGGYRKVTIKVSE